MKVEVKKIDELKREMKFVIPKERVHAVLEEVYEEIGKRAKVKGYRQGKVPRNLLEAEHGRYAQEEALRKLVPDAYFEGIKKENLSPIDYPEFHDVNFKDGIVTFTAKLDLKPEVKIKDYKGIKVVRKSTAVTDEDLAKTMEYFQKGQGEDKKIEFNDDFAKGMGFPSLEEFKNSLKRQMEVDKERQSKFDLENQIVEALLKKTKVPVPQSLLKRQIERRIEENLHHMKQHKADEKALKAREEELRKALPEIVEKDIKVYLILEKIAQLEAIEVKEGENLPQKVLEKLLKQAQWEEAK
jgi:trigger factor